MDAPLPEHAQALRRVRFFEDLTDDDLLRVARIGKRRHFDEGDVILEQGSQGLGLFIILSGTAVAETGAGEKPLGAGDFVGEMSLLARTERSATVRATSSCETMIIETMYFKPFLIENPSVAVTLLEGVAERLREVQGG